ncbi:MAG: phosphoribosylformylglycinamidine synthase subunit PurS [Gemmatimonadaceae bacterium]
MKRFRVAVHITPRRGILDPQGKAVAGALHALGFASVADVHVGRHIVVELDAADERSADREARAMCERLLANPVTEDFDVASVSAA